MSNHFFRNLAVYRLTQDVPAFRDLDTLNKAIGKHPARDPSSQELSTAGFSPAYRTQTKTLADREDPTLADDLEPKVPAYVRSVNNGEFLLIAMTETSRKIDSAGIKLALKRKVEQLEAQDSRKVYKKERDQLKDEIVQACLPHALLKENVTLAMIVPAESLILVDASSPKKAEGLLSLLREAIGSLPVRPIRTKLLPSTTMTEWVRKSACSHGFRLLNAVMMRDAAEGSSKVAAVHVDLESEEILNHLKVGREVIKLAIGYQDLVGFAVDDKLQITKVFFSDLLQDQAEADAGAVEDVNAVIDASMLIMGRTFVEMLPKLFEAFGGEETRAAL